MIDNKTLIAYAQKAMSNAYAPYSKFKVGATVLTKSGKYYTGANTENSSFGATVCAERNAINNALSCGERDFVKIAIVSSSGDYTYPCGICRQTLIEFNPKMEVIVAKNQDDYKVYSLDELLPYYFSNKDIKWEQLLKK